MVGSGSRAMSDSWIFWKPRIDEPSKARPSSKTSGPNEPAGHGEVLHDAGQVAEPDVDDLDALVLDVGQQLVGALEHLSSGELSGNGRDAAAPATDQGWTSGR